MFLQDNSRPYYFTPLEERANIWTHAAGVAISIVLIPLVIFWTRAHSLGLIVTCLLFTASMSAVYLCSTLSHLYQDEQKRNHLRAWDQGVIYFLIVGTYSPFIWQGSHGWQRAALLVTVWTVACWGFASKVLGRHRINSISTVSYLGLGWLPAIPLINTTPPICLQWMLWGGLSYTLGVAFLLLTRYIRFTHAIWHVMVLLGTMCHCVAIWHLIKLDGAQAAIS